MCIRNRAMLYVPVKPSSKVWGNEDGDKVVKGRVGKTTSGNGAGLELGKLQMAVKNR